MPPPDPTAGAGKRLRNFCSAVGLALLVGAAGGTAYIKYNPERRELERKTREHYEQEATAKQRARDEKFNKKEHDLEMDYQFKTQQTNAERQQFETVYANRTKELEASFADKTKLLEDSFTKKTKDLETKYCGALDDLLDASVKPSMTVLERDLYTLHHLGNSIDTLLTDEGKLLYKQTTNSVNITAKMITVKSGAFTNEYLVLLRRNASDGGILSAHLYGGSDIAKAEPHRTILFGENDAKLIDHQAATITRRAGSDVVYSAQGATATKAYLEHSKRVLQQFNDLYNRGPGDKPLTDIEHIEQSIDRKTEDIKQDLRDMIQIVKERNAASEKPQAEKAP